jgi:uncharacterized membrane protein
MIRNRMGSAEAYRVPEHSATAASTLTPLRSPRGPSSPNLYNPAVPLRPGAQRRDYIDWARGLAVLLMIEAHTTDAWTRAASRTTIGFRDVTILGGFAAPLFLWLAGLAVVLSASRTFARTGSREQAAGAVCRRGVEIFLLAFAFRLQAFIVSPGSHPIALFRVDILNVMGPAIVGAGLVWAATQRTTARVAAYAALTIAIAMVTPIVRASPIVDVLPTWVQWYLRPAGEHTTFTLLPWAGFVFAGGATGAVLAAGADRRTEPRVHAALAVCGALLIGVGFWLAARPPLYAVSSFWTSSPTWFAIRVGILMTALSALFAIEWIGRPAEGRQIGPFARAFVSWQAPLARLGRASLFVYWIHVELAYGYATWAIHRRLPLWLVLPAYLAFAAAMYGIVLARDRVALAYRGPIWRGRYAREPIGTAVE